ncbi:MULTISPECIES: PP2C family protein-serine/threonine phosphatase [Marinimicrobium]|jgi:protein phosphatase|uniref:Protein phosphatase n=1 Tax=Marinimicrobium koreense TaxID=306545 RepID=A0A3N1NYA0_9GAMM|nr:MULTISPECIES: protein phosphatase 2C domain-containing protein [Marinimicrobium]ROQ20288.1 protein phosphatase [Marinimicrobium koreense]
MPQPPLEYSAATHAGHKRDNNEDTLLSLPERGLWLVADGMGGHEAGEVASAIVRDTLLDQQHKSLTQAIQASHRAVLKAAANGEGAPGMGSTIVALRSLGDDYEVAWVGDSRAYLWTHTEDGGRLERLTTDHSYVQMLLASGVIEEAEVEGHPDKNIITQCLGSYELQEVKVDSVRGQWLKDQWILLCSDGLTDELDDEALARLLFRCRSPRAAVNRLMRAALDAGGRDNITLQLIQSPLSQRSRWSTLWQWVPHITGRRGPDLALYATALLSLALVLYWVAR